jgi:hypothetical protein
MPKRLCLLLGLKAGGSRERRLRVSGSGAPKPATQKAVPKLFLPAKVSGSLIRSTSGRLQLNAASKRKDPGEGPPT